MTLFRRFTAVVLCLCLVMTLFGCNQKPDTPTSETEPPLSPAMAAYTQARTAVDNAADMRLQIQIKKTTTVGGEVFTEETNQTLRQARDDAGNISATSTETVFYGDYTATYDEIYHNGTLYLTANNLDQFCSPMTEEEYLRRTVPAVLLDGALYGEVTQEGNTITFKNASAAESWAIPEDAELVEASGTAQFTDAGELRKTTYSLTYKYGSAEITLNADVRVVLEDVTVEAPAKADDYTELEHVDAVRLADSAIWYLFESNTVTLSSLESVMSQAAGFIHNQSRTVNTWGTGEDFLAKIEYGSFMMSASGEEKYELEELFRDGVYTAAEDKGEPQPNAMITAPMMESYCEDFLPNGIMGFEYWNGVTVTDMGSLYMLELTFSDAVGEGIQGDICKDYFGNANLLMDLASDYRTETLTGYISIDKYTGLLVAAGYQYEGVHTLDGDDYILSFQKDQSVEAPALGAYFEITEEMLPEEEPETKATPLFYHVTGPNGQEMWLLGTVHVGDERTAYLPQEIYDALLSSDALALEFYSDEFDRQIEEDEALQDAISDAYYYGDGTTTADHLDPELYEDALLYLKAIGGYNMNAEYMKPYLWSQQIDNFYLRQGYQLTSDQGVESRLEAIAEENGIEIRDVESGLFQVQMTTGWSEELQSLLLEESIGSDAIANWQGTMDLFDLWCAGDEEAMRERLSDEVDTSEFTQEEMAEYQEQKPYLDEYNKSMSYDRNDGMLEVAISYLESGETVFYAVGLAHLLNNYNGLVDTLRTAGYTVELVEYAG